MSSETGRIRFRCRCGREMETAASNAGKEGRCPVCGAVVPIPKRPTPAASASGAEASGDDGLIRFRCECGHPLKTSRENRRRKFRCPQCHRLQMVPDRSTRRPARPTPPPAVETAAGAAPVAEEVPDFEDLSLEEPLEAPLLEPERGTETPGPAASAEDEGETFELAFAEPLEAEAPRPAVPTAASAVCPACGEPRAPGSVLCVNCGYSFRTGAHVGEGRGPIVRPADTSFAGFMLGFLDSFVYPLRGFAEIAKGAWVAWCFMLVALIPCLGILLLPLALLAVLGYAGAYAVSIIHYTLEGEDDPVGLPGVSMDSLFVPLWWQFVLGLVFCGPAAVVTAAAVRVPELIGVAAALWAFAYLALPMGLLIVSGEGKLRPAQVKGVFVSLLRSPGHYLIFLVMLGFGMAIVTVVVGVAWNLLALVMSQTLVTKILLMGVATYVSWLINFYLVAAYARALGIFGRYRYDALDFGGGARAGLNPLAGAAIVGAVFLLLAGAGFGAVTVLRPYVEDAIKRGEGTGGLRRGPRMKIGSPRSDEPPAAPPSSSDSSEPADMSPPGGYDR